MTATTETAHIRLRGVHKSFGDKQVLNGVELSLRKGASLVVVGGSGTGKSVLLKSILGLIPPDQGEIFVNGRDIVPLKGTQRDRLLTRFGVLFQSGALFDSLCVWQNVAFGLIQAKKLPVGQARDIAYAKLALVGLPSDSGRLFPAELSGGMLKRVALARAIAADPEIMLFDEPTTGLDPVMSNVINDLIVACVKRLGATAISITHDMLSARRIADDIAMLHHGRVIWRGPAHELNDSGNPVVDRFVRGEKET